MQVIFVPYTFFVVHSRRWLFGCGFDGLFCINCHCRSLGIWGAFHRRFSVPAPLSFPCAPRTADADLPPARFQAGKRTVQRGSDRGSFVRRILTTAHSSFAARTIPFSLPTRGNIRPDRKVFCAASPKTLGVPFAPSCTQPMKQNDPASRRGQDYKDIESLRPNASRLPAGDNCK